MLRPSRRHKTGLWRSVAEVTAAGSSIDLNRDAAHPCSLAQHATMSVVSQPGALCQMMGKGRDAEALVSELDAADLFEGEPTVAELATFSLGVLLTRCHVS